MATHVLSQLNAGSSFRVLHRRESGIDSYMPAQAVSPWPLHMYKLYTETEIEKLELKVCTDQQAVGAVDG